MTELENPTIELPAVVIHLKRRALWKRIMLYPRIAKSHYGILRSKNMPIWSALNIALVLARIAVFGDLWTLRTGAGLTTELENPTMGKAIERPFAGQRVILRSLLLGGACPGMVLVVDPFSKLCVVKIDTQKQPIDKVLYFDKRPVSVDSPLWQICYPEQERN